MRRFIFVVCILFCLSACKKEHVDPMSASTNLNRLPKKVLVKKGDSYIIQKYTYNHKGLVTKVCMYDSLTPNQQDSIIYTYHAFSDKLQSRSIYFGDETQSYGKYTSSQNYVYDNQGRLSVLYDGDSIYVYHYTAVGEVDYFIRSNVAMSVKDSIKMYPDAAWTYFGNGDGTYGEYDATNDRYMASIVEFYSNTDNGVYEFRGPWYDTGPMVISTTICINKEIEFQDEVTYTIVPIGQAGYYNMYSKFNRYKYASHADYVINPRFNFSQYDATYTFDSHGRLKVINAQALGMPDNDTPSAIPAVLDFTSTIYY